MGALTSNRKRGGGDLSYISSSPFDSLRFDLHQVSNKKPKFSPMLHPNSTNESHTISCSVSSQSTFSRVHAYPQPTKPLRRELHAPIRTHKFSNSMGNTNSFLFSNVEKAKRVALSTFRHVVEEEECEKDVVSDVASAEEEEEVEVLGSRRNRERQGDVEILDDSLKEKYESFANNRVLQGSSSVVSDLSNQTPKADDVGKMLGNLSVVEEVREPPHKKMYKEAEKRNSKLRHISFLIELTTKKLPFFRRTEKKKPKDDLRCEALVPLTDEEQTEVSRAFSNANRRKILVTHPDSNIEITGEALQCLKPGAWLNDEVINLYLELLKEREKREPKKFLKCHFFNTFFYKKLISGKGGYDFKAVRRWTTQRKIGYGLVDCDKIFVPIHKEIHWCLAIINKKDEKFQYLDSLKGTDLKVLNVLAKYYVDEVKDKSGKDIDVTSWKQECIKDLPAQKNGYDCGMFMVKYADFYSRGLGLCFNQENMPYFRVRTVKEILRLKAE